MPNSSQSYDWLWIGLTLLIILLLAFLLPLIPNDYWWYVRLGQDIMADGRVPVEDAYSYTQPGYPIVYQSWLASVILWLVYAAGGVPLTFLLRGVVLGITYTLLWKIIRSAELGPKSTSLVVMVAALAGSNNWSHRPQLLAYPLFVCTLWLLWQREQGRERGVWWLVPLSWLWANLHGSFPLFFALTGAALVFGKGRRKKFCLVFGASVLVTLLNPRGLALWGSVVETFLTPGSRNLSVEWGPPLNDNWQMGIFFLWLLIFPLITVQTNRRLSLLEWIWFLGFGWLALSGMRYVIWFLFVLAVLTAYLFSDFVPAWLDRPRKGDVPFLNILLAVGFIFLPLVAMPGLRESWWVDAPSPLADNTPVDAIEWLSMHEELPGQLWSDIAYASYQIFALPARLVWIDTRFQVAFPPEQFDEYMQITEAEKNWPGLLEKYEINLLLLSREKQAKLITVLSSTSEYCAVYEDSRSLIYSRLQEGVPCVTP